jgi:hypothetical protein
MAPPATRTFYRVRTGPQHRWIADLSPGRVEVCQQHPVHADCGSFQARFHRSRGECAKPWPIRGHGVGDRAQGRASCPSCSHTRRPHSNPSSARSRTQIRLVGCRRPPISSNGTLHSRSIRCRTSLATASSVSGSLEGQGDDWRRPWPRPQSPTRPREDGFPGSSRAVFKFLVSQRCCTDSRFERQSYGGSSRPAP